MSKRRAQAETLAAVIYLRVSTQGQADSGLGSEAQEAACRALAARQGWPVVSVHLDDGVSGTLPVERRPGLLAAVQACRAQEGRAFVVYSVSRAARSVPELYRLVDPTGPYGVPLVSVSEPIDMSTAAGRMMLGVLAAFAAFESDLASERTTAALGAAKARGVKLGNPSIIERRGEDGGVEIDPAKVALVRQVHALRAAGVSIRGIADRLNAAGIASALGARWHGRTVVVALGVDLATLPPETTDGALTVG